MKLAVFSAKPYDRQFLDDANRGLHETQYFEFRLDSKTAKLVDGFEAVCPFVNDKLDRETLEILKARDVRLIALRCAGYNNVDLAAARSLGIAVARVPAYSPTAVAEHTMALILSLNRHVHRAYARVRDGNFSLEGMLGFNMHGQTVGLVGVGRIGLSLARILLGFGCLVLGVDPARPAGFTEMGGRYVELDELLQRSGLISLHCPLTPETRHIIDCAAIGRMKAGVMLINTSRGAVIDTAAVIAGLKSGKIGLLGLDVYEEEEDIFFEDRSEEVLQDDMFARLLTFPNVLITGHQAYFTQEAMIEIAKATIANIAAFAEHGKPIYAI